MAKNTPPPVKILLTWDRQNPAYDRLRGVVALWKMENLGLCTVGHVNDTVSGTWHNPRVVILNQVSCAQLPFLRSLTRGPHPPAVVLDITSDTLIPEGIRWVESNDALDDMHTTGTPEDISLDDLAEGMQEALSLVDVVTCSFANMAEELSQDPRLRERVFHLPDAASDPEREGDFLWTFGKAIHKARTRAFRRYARSASTRMTLFQRYHAWLVRATQHSSWSTMALKIKSQ